MRAFWLWIEQVRHDLLAKVGSFVAAFAAEPRCPVLPAGASQGAVLIDVRLR